MALVLVLHDLGPIAPEAEQAFFEAIFSIAPDHWRTMPQATLVGTEVSPGYLLHHLKEAARRARFTPRLLMVTPVPPEMLAEGLGPDGEAWVREMRG